MNLLFIGGTGILSSASTRLALARGLQGHAPQPGGVWRPWRGVEHLTTDINDPAAAAAAIGTRRWDVVVDFIAFTPAQMQERIALQGPLRPVHLHQLSQRLCAPVAHYLITESTPPA